MRDLTLSCAFSTTLKRSRCEGSALLDCWVVGCVSYCVSDLKMWGSCSAVRSVVAYHCFCMASLFRFMRLTYAFFIGPAVHLANLVPSGVCLHRPSPSTIQTYLEQFTLPLETIALAGCVLDSLSLRFSRKLRESFASVSIEVPSGPEVIVLAALALATSYHLDDHFLASHWTNIVALGSVNTQQFNIASRCVLVDINYGLHSFTPAMIEETLQDMQRAGGTTCVGQDDVCYFTTPNAKSPCILSHGHGNAVETNGLMTPEPTPP